jgi:hypothetical protein
MPVDPTARRHATAANRRACAVLLAELGRDEHGACSVVAEAVTDDNPEAVQQMVHSMRIAAGHAIRIANTLGYDEALGYLRGCAVTSAADEALTS